VSDAEISEVLRNADAGVGARELVDLAFDQGSRDNITAVIAEILAGTDPRDGWLPSLPAAGKSD
jgi:serine/threonine protein phosphatase PrpC